MSNMSLDQWGVITPKDEMKIPLVISDAHADYLYETSYERMVEKNYDILIDERLAEEKAEKEAHKEYINKNYIRIGGN